ncbi:MAG: hypothetical protein OXG33_00735 [Chloroflexi bacterium]|nr:hypothetical protein [Chloroflexota bacterium]
MSLDPAASLWPGVIASVAVCLWIAAIGALFAYAVFRDRPRLVWPFYAPFVGVAVVLLVTNLAAYVIPGAPSAWFGLIATSALGIVAARRSGALRLPPEGSRTALLAMAAMAVGVFALAYATRTHEYPFDGEWHYALIFRLARGEFPPVTPYGVDAGIGYHYGADLLAASIINVARVFPWTAFDALAAFLVGALVLAVAGFAYDTGAPLPLALGIGVTVGLFYGRIFGYFDGGVFLGYRTGYLEDLAIFGSQPTPRPAFLWMKMLQRPLAVGCVVLVAAAFTRARHALLLAAAAGVLALGDTSVTIFGCAALALVGVIRLVRLRGSERLTLAGALVASALLVVLAGGPISDEIFDRGGTAGLVRVAWEPDVDHFLLFHQSGSALVRLGAIPLIAVGAFAAYRRRSWGLGVLTAAGAFGLLEAQLLQSVIPWQDDRILWLTHAVAMIAALSGVGALIGALRRPVHRRLAVVFGCPPGSRADRPSSGGRWCAAGAQGPRNRRPGGRRLGASLPRPDLLGLGDRSELGAIHLAPGQSANRGAPPYAKAAHQRISRRRCIPPLPPRSANVRGHSHHVGLRRRAAVPASRRPLGYGHHAPPPDRRHGRQPRSFRQAPARRPEPLQAAD